MSTKTQKYIFTGKLAGVATPMIHNQLIVEASVSDALCTALSMIDNVAFDFELKLNERKDIKIDGTRIDVTVTATKLPDAATIMGTLFKNRSAHTRAQVATKAPSVNKPTTKVTSNAEDAASASDTKTKRASSYGFTKDTYDTWLRLAAAGEYIHTITKLFKVRSGHVHMYVTGKRNWGFDPNSELFKLAQSNQDIVRLAPTSKDVLQLIGYETMKMIDLDYMREHYSLTHKDIALALNSYKSNNVKRLLAMSAIPSVD